jgi:hypothetical protein
MYITYTKDQHGPHYQAFVALGNYPMEPWSDAASYRNASDWLVPGTHDPYLD